MSKELLEIKDLHVNAGEKEILKGLNLKINIPCTSWDMTRK